MELKNLLKHTSEWLKGSGPNSDIVISSRIRLARNLSETPFPHWADKAQGEGVLSKIRHSLLKSESLKSALFLELAKMDSIDKQFLVERHLMSLDHTQKANNKAIVIDEDEVVSLMINEEDHIRMQVMQSGFNLFEAWNIINKIDEALAKELSFAFLPDWGYLTACPTNAGTGMRGSVMLHLPGLVITRSIDRVLAAIAKLSFTTRGFYGEGTKAMGNFFQISNQISLGPSEDEIIESINGLIRQIIEQENQAREALFSKNNPLLEDRINRSLGILKSVLSLVKRQLVASMVRLGSDLGMVKILIEAGLMVLS